MKRRLAAILAADAVGNSRLLGEDEAGTLMALKAHREKLIDPKIAEHYGRIVKRRGGAMLVEFASVADAVEVRRAMVELARTSPRRSRPDRRRLVFAIGGRPAGSDRLGAALQSSGLAGALTRESRRLVTSEMAAGPRACSFEGDGGQPFAFPGQIIRRPGRISADLEEHIAVPGRGAHQAALGFFRR